MTVCSRTSTVHLANHGHGRKGVLLQVGGGPALPFLLSPASLLRLRAEKGPPHLSKPHQPTRGSGHSHRCSESLTHAAVQSEDATRTESPAPERFILVTPNDQMPALPAAPPWMLSGRSDSAEEGKSFSPQGAPDRNPCL